MSYFHGVGVLVALLPILFTLTPAHAQSSTDWPTKGRSFSRTYHTPSELTLSGTNKLNLKWSRFFGERLEVDMEPVVVGNTVYIGVMNGKLYALNKDTGAVRWTYQSGGPIHHTPTVATVNNRLTVYVGAYDGTLYAIDATTGAEIWKYSTGGPIMSTPTLIDSTVYIGSTDRFFYAINGATGSFIWKYPTAGPISITSAAGTLSSGEKIIYVASDNNIAYALRTNGSLLWSKQMRGAHTKHSTVVVSNNRAIFMTRKPGREYSEHIENKPTFNSTMTPATIISTWADFYITYPERRTLYIFDATTGQDMWQPSSNKSKYTPLYIPYWGQYSAVIDTQGNAYIPSSGGAGDGNLNHDIRLWKLNLNTGDHTHHANQSQFLIRFDEIGRPSLIGSRYYQTISEDVGFFDVTSYAKTAVYGNGFWSHRYPNELSELPSTIFGGMHKHFPRFGSSTPGGFAGANDATSPLVVANNEAYVTSWGHLYALTGASTTPAKLYQNLDLAKPMKLPRTPATIQAELQSMAQKLVSDTKPLHPVSRFWLWRNVANAGVFWHDGETARSLADAIPHINEPVKSQFATYVKNYFQTNLLDSKKYEYASACLVFPEKAVVGSCPSNKIVGGGWYWSNQNHVAERLYAFYRYGVATNDWSFITSNWSFIKARYQQINNGWNSDAGFFLWEGWIAGNFKPHIQMGAMLAVREMAIKANDTAVRDSANNYLTQMQSKRVYWGRYVRSLYASGQLTRNDYTDPNSWAYEGADSTTIPIPKEGYMDQTNDYRQPYSLSLSNNQVVASFSNIRNAVYPYELIGFHPLLPEFGSLIKNNLSDELQDYIDAIEIYAPTWYMGDYNRQPLHVGHEDESMSPKVAVDLFLAKAYVFNQSFDQLAPQLPIGFEDYGHRDISRYQTLVALLKAPTSGTYPTLTPTPNRKPGDANGDGKVDDSDYAIWRTNYNQTKTGGATIGDFNNNGKVEGLDYVVWLTNYGK
jgi:outer membrane protein assembly factor BamB